MIVDFNTTIIIGFIVLSLLFILICLSIIDWYKSLFSRIVYLNKYKKKFN